MLVMHNQNLAIISFDMKNKENFVLDLKDTLRSTLVALLFSLLFVLVFALILRWASLDDSVITPVNYVIKFLSLFLGIMIGFKHPKNGILKGAIVGLIFMLLSFFLFSAMDGFKSANFRPLDLVFLALGGGIVGVIRVNLKLKKA